MAKGILIALAVMLIVPSAKAVDPSNYTTIAVAPNGGYWVQIYDAYGHGKTIALNGAPQFESIPYIGFITSSPGVNGYWIVTPNGKIINRGAAASICNGDLTTYSNFRPGHGDKPLSSAAVTPDGRGRGGRGTRRLSMGRGHRAVLRRRKLRE
ncbi:MAG: hypothetical protein WDN23_11395 [Edaphobacter sp.]